MAFKLTIGGTDRTSLIRGEDRATWTRALSGRGTARFTCLPSLVPARFSEVLFYDQAGTTALWGGIINPRTVAGVIPGALPNRASVSCADFGWYADQCYQTKTYSVAVAPETVVGDLVTDKLAAYGITFTPPTTGLTLEPFAWVGKRVSDCLREVMTKTVRPGGVGYVYEFLASKALSMFVPGSVAAPTSTTDTSFDVDDLTWTDSSQVPATDVLLVCGPSGTAPVTQVWTANGTDTSWVTDLAATDPPPGYVTLGVDEYCTIGAGAMFTWDAATHTLAVGTHAVPDNGTTITLVYIALYPFTVTATNGGSPAIEYIASAPDIVSKPAGQEYADGLVLQLGQTGREVTAPTKTHGFAPGQAWSVDSTARGLTATCLVSTVTATLISSSYWTYTVKATESTVYPGGAIDQLRAMLGGGGSGSAVVLAGSGGGGSSVSSASGSHHLGGDRYQFQQTAAWVAILGWLTFECQTTGTYTVRYEVCTTNAATSVQARLYDLTDAAAVSGSETTASVQTAWETHSATVALLAGHLYQAQMIGSDAVYGIRVGQVTLVGGGGSAVGSSTFAVPSVTPGTGALPYLDAATPSHVSWLVAGSANTELVPAGVGAAPSWRQRPVFDVRAYGAVGDGTTDCTTAIQDAIDAASAGAGGIVYFPPGVYRTTARLVVSTSGVWLRGGGEAGPVSYGAPTYTGAMILGDFEASGSDLDVLHIQGAIGTLLYQNRISDLRVGTDGTLTTPPNGIHVECCSEFAFDHVAAVNCRAGFRFNSSSIGVVAGFYGSTNTYGVELTDEAGAANTRLTFTGGNVWDSEADAFAVVGACRSITIRDTWLEYFVNAVHFNQTADAVLVATDILLDAVYATSASPGPTQTRLIRGTAFAGGSTALTVDGVTLRNCTGFNASSDHNLEYVKGTNASGSSYMDRVTIYDSKFYGATVSVGASDTNNSSLFLIGRIDAATTFGGGGVSLALGDGTIKINPLIALYGQWYMADGWPLRLPTGAMVDYNTDGMLAFHTVLRRPCVTAAGALKTIPVEAAAQGDSTATDVAGVVSDLNTLLGKLRTANVIGT